MTRAGLGLPPTAALFFRLAGSPPHDPELRRLLAGAIAWPELRALARREVASAAVRRRLEAAEARLPEPERAALEREARVADFHQLRLQARLVAVLKLLAEGGLRPVLLKGAGLALSAYPSWVDRPMSDLDLLLPPAEAREAQRILGAAGWTAEPVLPTSYAEHHHLPPLRAPGGDRAVVELHSALLTPGHPYGLDAPGVLARAWRVAAPAGTTALVPSPEDQLLHAALHFAWSHELRWGAWRLVADVQALLAAGDADAAVRWERLRPLAQASGAGRPLYWSLRLAAALGGVPVPDGWLAALRPRLAGAAERLLARHVALQVVPGAGRVPSEAVARAVWAVALDAGGGDAPRPWRLGVNVTREARAPTPSLGRRLLGQATRLGRWARYLRALSG